MIDILAKSLHCPAEPIQLTLAGILGRFTLSYFNKVMFDWHRIDMAA